MKIFGREPAAWIGLIEGLLAFLMVFGLDDIFSTDQVALIMAAVVAVLGFLTAYLTKDVGLGIIVGLAKALMALFIGFGLTLTEVQTGAAIALITVVFSFFNRASTSPVVEPGF